MFEPLFDQMQEMASELESRDELFATMARINKKAFDASLAVGFTKEQAILIVANQGSGLNANAS